MAQNVLASEVAHMEGKGNEVRILLSVTSDKSLTLRCWDIGKDCVMLVIVLTNIPHQALLCFLPGVMKTNTKYICC